METPQNPEKCCTIKAKVEKYNRAGREDRRNRILDEAFALFIERGFQDIKMDEIAQRAGFGKSTLYEYFNSKDEIFEEVLRVHVINPYEALAADVDKTLAPFDKLCAYLSGEMELMLEFSGTGNVLPLVTLHPEYFISPTLFAACRKILEHKYRTITGFIREGVEKGDFRDIEPILAASIVIGASGAFFRTITAPEFVGILKESVDTAKESAIFFDMIKRALSMSSRDAIASSPD